MTYTLIVARGVLTDVDVETEHLSGRPAQARLATLATPDDVERETADADAVVVTIEPLPRESIERFGPRVRLDG